MDLYTVEKTDDSITIGIKDANNSVLTPLIDCLNRDPSVKLVRYIETHPELDDHKLLVVVNEGSPQEALIRATDEMRTYFSNSSVSKQKINPHPSKSYVYRVKGPTSEVYRVDGSNSELYRTGGE